MRFHKPKTGLQMQYTQKRIALLPFTQALNSEPFMPNTKCIHTKTLKYNSRKFEWEILNLNSSTHVPELHARFEPKICRSRSFYEPILCGCEIQGLLGTTGSGFRFQGCDFDLKVDVRFRVLPLAVALQR